MPSSVGLQPASPVWDLIGYQRQVAIEDAAWSSGSSAARNAFEQDLSDAYNIHATSEHGPLGSVPTRIHATGQATAARIGGLAASDAGLSIAATDHLADFTEAVQSAASQAAQEGVQAETQYDLARAEARRDYRNALAAAELIHTTSWQDANLAYIVQVPYPYPNPDTWLNSGPELAARSTRDAAWSAADTARDNAHQQAQIAHAAAIGAAQVARANALGTALINEATAKKQAEDAYWAQQKMSEDSYETAVTAATLPGIQGEAAAERDYNLVAPTHAKNFTTAYYAALVTLNQQFAPLQVQRAANIVAAEGDFHTAQANRLATRQAAFAASAPTVSQASFDAAAAAAEALWVAGMKPAVVAFTTAITQAEADESLALITATAIAENARAVAAEIHVAAVECHRAD